MAGVRLHSVDWPASTYCYSNFNPIGQKISFVTGSLLLIIVCLMFPLILCIEMSFFIYFCIINMFVMCAIKLLTDLLT